MVKTTTTTAAAEIVRASIVTDTPRKTAEWFRFALATDRGYTSTLRRVGADYIVTASDGQAVRFLKPAA